MGYSFYGRRGKRKIRRAAGRAVAGAKRRIFTKRVKKVINRMAEHKQSEISLDTVPYANAVPIVAGANAFIALTTLAQSTDNSGRLGDQVEGWVKIRGMVRNTTAAACVCRLTVVQDIAQSNTISANTVPVQSNIYVTPTDLYSNEFIKQRRYNIIKHKVYNLGPVSSGSGQMQFSFKIPKRIMNWTAGTAAATDMSKGLSYLAAESEVASALEWTFNACTYFTDL